MKSRIGCKALLVAAALIVAVATPAHAQAPAFELGTSLLGLTVNWGEGNQTTTTFGLPSGFGGFGVVQPGVYVSFFAGSRLAIEPQIGLVLLSGGGHSEHFLNVAGQVDYFFKGTEEASPYAFGSVGILDISGAGFTPKSLGAGVGYRMLLGSRLAIRADGRILHFTDQLGNAVVFQVSLGGVFNRR